MARIENLKLRIEQNRGRRTEFDFTEKRASNECAHIRCSAMELPKKLVIPVGLHNTKQTVLPLCITNPDPDIPRVWHACRKCTRIFKTADERDKHKKEHKTQSSRKKLTENESNALVAQTEDVSDDPPSSKKRTLATPFVLLKGLDSRRISDEEASDKVHLDPTSSSDDDPSTKNSKRLRTVVRNLAPTTKRIPCDCCPETFLTRKDLQRHKMLQSNNKIISLGTPPKSNNAAMDVEATTARLNNHADTMNGIESTICSYCHKDFGFPDTLKRHLRTHEDQDSQEQTITKLNMISPRTRESRKLLSGQRAKQIAALNKGERASKRLLRKNIIFHSHLESLSPEQIF